MQGNVDESWPEPYQIGDAGKFIQLSGRWPANFLLDSETAKRLDEMSGELHGGGNKHAMKQNRGGSFGGGRMGSEYIYDNGGGASSFFFTYQADQLDEADPVKYCAKASRAERNAGCFELPRVEYKMQRPIDGNLATSPLANRNPHPTVKPIALTRYLATLLLPPAEYAPRRLLVPFAGVGSEMIGARLAGWEEVTGIELNEEYIEIGKARLAHWLKQNAQIKMSL